MRPWTAFLIRLRDFRMLPLAGQLPPRERLGLRVVAAGMLAALGLYTAVAAGLNLGSALQDLVEDWLYNVLLFSAAAMCLGRGWRLPDQRGAWLVLGWGMVLWGLGNVYWTIEINDLEEFPYPSIADYLWLLSYPAFYVALMLLARARIERLQPSVWLDGLVGMLAVAALGAAFLLPVIVANTQESLAAAATNLAYPLADLLLIALVVSMGALTGWRPGPAWVLIGTGFTTLAVADSLYLIREAEDTYVANTPMDALWPLGMVILACAAWQSWQAPHTTAFEGWSVLIFPSLFTMASLGVLVYGNLVKMNAVALVFAAATVIAALGRTSLTFKEVRSLADIRRQAATDELTGLANRRGFHHRLESVLSTAREEGSEVAVIVADLDGFKDLNDTLGHHAGDLVLRQIGPRLMGALRPEDLLARLGGDEFAALLPRSGPLAAVGLAERLRAAFERPFPVLEITVHVEASVGVAMFPAHGDDAESLMQRADVAMYQAKAARSGYEIYAPERDEHNRSRLELLGGMRRAIDARELLVHYQPKADLRTGEVVGVEALVRWDHPERGLLLPKDFLPMAESTGLMKSLALQVLDTALRDRAAWEATGFSLSVAVNLSVPNLVDANLPRAVASLLSRRGMAPDQLALEITENAVIADPIRAGEVLAQLSALGIIISLDDFGVGHSSLSHLKYLPVDELKIDKSFVVNMQSNESDAAIVRSTSELAGRLGLAVVAEGVEDARACQLLADFGCQFAQGNFLASPLPSAKLVNWLRSGACSARVPVHSESPPRSETPPV